MLGASAGPRLNLHWALGARSGSRKAAVHWAHANLLVTCMRDCHHKAKLEEGSTKPGKHKEKSQVIKASWWSHPNQREKPSCLYSVLLPDGSQFLYVSWNSPVHHQNIFVTSVGHSVVTTGRQEKLCKDLSLSELPQAPPNQSNTANRQDRQLYRNEPPIHVNSFKPKIARV